MTQPDVSAVIVTYNSAHVIEACLGALVVDSGTAIDSDTAIEIEVIVYDNASSDETVDVVLERFPTVHVIRGAENLGFAKAVNRAASVACGHNIMLLNPDAVIDSVSVGVLRDAVPSTRGGVVAPMIEHSSGLVRVVSAGRMPTSWRMFTHYFGLSRLAEGREWLEGHYCLPSEDLESSPFEADWVTGACLMVDAETWRRMDGLCERWFMYAEDIEFCWRVGKAGGKVLVQPAATAQHLVGSSNSEQAAHTNSAWVINLYDFYAADLARNRAQRLWWGVVVSSGLSLRACVFLIQSIVDRRNAPTHRVSAGRFLEHSRAIAGRTLSYVNTAA
ncbi:glycosyltransferase family 2 protein [Rhodococcoides fascians]|uniref:glycosyltransferase family 2 protein n=1 Tax=Rhodococcoides fascians TaxID=1828 RepID=UPI00056A7847|nr:glycosyltransferase family 2 protein [Rhodococcus fascians]